MTEWPNGVWAGMVRSYDEENDQNIMTKHRTAAETKDEAMLCMSLVHRVIIMGYLDQYPFADPDLN